MNRLFTISKPFQVPDDTLVSPFLNPKDNCSGLPFDLFDGFSIAAGVIEPGISSKIHLHPHVSQVTFVRSGNLKIYMKGPDDKDKYPLEVKRNEGVLSDGNTYFQLVNQGTQPCEVLYIVSPAYLFELTDGKVIYDDAVIVEEDWVALEKGDWRTKSKIPTSDERNAAYKRLAKS